jgi:hypothetical protein
VLTGVDYDGADKHMFQDRERDWQLQFNRKLVGNGRNGHIRRRIYPEWHRDGDDHGNLDAGQVQVGFQQRGCFGSSNDHLGDSVVLAGVDYDSAKEHMYQDRERDWQLQFNRELVGNGRNDHIRRRIYPEWHRDGDDHGNLDAGQVQVRLQQRDGFDTVRRDLGESLLLALVDHDGTDEHMLRYGKRHGKLQLDGHLDGNGWNDHIRRRIYAERHRNGNDHREINARHNQVGIGQGDGIGNSNNYGGEGVVLSVVDYDDADKHMLQNRERDRKLQFNRELVGDGWNDHIRGRIYTERRWNGDNHGNLDAGHEQVGIKQRGSFGPGGRYPVHGLWRFDHCGLHAKRSINPGIPGIGCGLRERTDDQSCDQRQPSV